MIFQFFFLKFWLGVSRTFEAAIIKGVRSSAVLLMSILSANNSASTIVTLLNHGEWQKQKIIRWLLYLVIIFKYLANYLIQNRYLWRIDVIKSVLPLKSTALMHKSFFFFFCLFFCIATVILQEKCSEPWYRKRNVVDVFFIYSCKHFYWRTQNFNDGAVFILLNSFAQFFSDFIRRFFLQFQNHNKMFVLMFEKMFLNVTIEFVLHWNCSRRYQYHACCLVVYCANRPFKKLQNWKLIAM